MLYLVVPKNIINKALKPLLVLKDADKTQPIIQTITPIVDAVLIFIATFA